MSTASQHCEEAARLCKMLAPADLDGVTVRVLVDTELPDRLRCHDECGGYFSPVTWAEIGLPEPSAIIVVAGRTLEDSTARGGRVPPLDFLDVLVHELAHLLCAPEPYTVPACGVEAAVCYLHEPPAIDWWDGYESASRAEPWCFHGADFVRAVLHLRHRARRLGLPVCPLAAGSEYALSSLDRYAADLGDEPRRLAGLSLREILSRPLPRLFAARFAEDVHRRGATERVDPVSIVEAIKSRLLKRKQARVENYDDLVRTVADGSEPSPDDAERVLADAGKTAADLEADVAAVHRRRDDQRTVEAAVAARHDLGMLDAQDRAEDKAFADRRDKHLREKRRRAMAMKALQQQIAAGREAEKRLRESAPDSLQAERRELSAQLLKLGAEKRRLEDMVRHAAANEREAMERAKRAGESLTGELREDKITAGRNLTVARAAAQRRDSYKLELAKIAAAEQDVLRQQDVLNRRMVEA